MVNGGKRAKSFVFSPYALWLAVGRTLKTQTQQQNPKTGFLIFFYVALVILLKFHLFGDKCFICMYMLFCYFVEITFI